MNTRFAKSTLGVDAQILVASALEYTAAATYTAFVEAAVEGSFGLFNAATNALIPGSLTPTAAGTMVFAAVIRGGRPKKTTAFPLKTGVTKAAYTAPVKQVSTITSVAAPAAPAAGDYYELVIVETTPGLEPLPRWSYGVEAKAGEAYATVLTRLVALINNTQAIENQNKDLLVTAAIAAVDDITLTAKEFNTHFTVALRGKLAENASHAITTKFKYGSGTYAQVADLEMQGNVREGIGHYYPDQNATAAEFGLPASLAAAAATYNLYKIKGYTEDPTRTLGKEVRLNYWILAIPTNGAANPVAEVDYAFGF